MSPFHHGEFKGKSTDSF